MNHERFRARLTFCLVAVLTAFGLLGLLGLASAIAAWLGGA